MSRDEEHISINPKDTAQDTDIFLHNHEKG